MDKPGITATLLQLLEGDGQFQLLEPRQHLQRSHHAVLPREPLQSGRILNWYDDTVHGSVLPCLMNLIPDPHGQAALMLCESLIILLVERGLISKEQVVAAIEAVTEVKQEIAGTTESAVVSVVSIGLLRTITLSMSALPAPMIPPVVGLADP